MENIAITKMSYKEKKTLRRNIFLKIKWNKWSKLRSKSVLINNLQFLFWLIGYNAFFFFEHHFEKCVRQHIVFATGNVCSYFYVNIISLFHHLFIEFRHFTRYFPVKLRDLLNIFWKSSQNFFQKVPTTCR